MSAIAGAGLKSLKKASKPKPKSGGGRGDLLDAIRNPPTLRKSKPEGDEGGGADGGGGRGGGGGGGGGGMYGGEVDGKWVNKKPPAGMDMFAEMDWKKRQKAAKAEWEAEQGGESDASDDEVARRQDLTEKLAS